jgi:hypothetical protein
MARVGYTDAPSLGGGREVCRAPADCDDLAAGWSRGQAWSRTQSWRRDVGRGCVQEGGYVTPPEEHGRGQGDCDRPPGFGPFLLMVRRRPRRVSVVDLVDARVALTGPGRMWAVALTSLRLCSLPHMRRASTSRGRGGVGACCIQRASRRARPAPRAGC